MKEKKNAFDFMIFRGENKDHGYKIRVGDVVHYQASGAKYKRHGKVLELKNRKALVQSGVVKRWILYKWITALVPAKGRPADVLGKPKDKEGF